MKKKSINILILFILIVSICRADIPFSYQPCEDTTKNKNLTFDIDADAFFINNEFKRKIAYGYTLPGVRLTPRLVYGINDKINISAGFSALRFWGANLYPISSYDLIPYYTEPTQKGVHITPYLNINVWLKKNLKFTLGSLDNQNCHFLPTPLYNDELIHTQDPEEGLQLQYFGSYFVNDVWLHWQNFNYFDDIDRESLLLGLSGKLVTNKNIYKPRGLFSYSLMWQHHGGELDTVRTPDLDHWLNASVSLGFSHSIKGYLLTYNLDYVLCKSLKNDTWFFKNGYGLFPTLSLENEGLSSTIGYYYSKDMVSLYGLPFYGNVCQRNTSDYYLENSMIYFSLAYKRKILESFNYQLFTKMFYKLDTTTCLQEEQRSLSISIGVNIDFRESFLIKRF